MKITVPVTFDIPSDMYRVEEWGEEDLLSLENTPKFYVTGCAPTGIDNYTVQDIACALLTERGWVAEKDFIPDSEYSQLFINTDSRSTADSIHLAVIEATAYVMAESASALTEGLIS